MNLDQALCRGDHELFDATDTHSHNIARAICAECPVIGACAQLLLEVQQQTSGTRGAGGGPSGTWAGQLIGKNGRRDAVTPIRHGTSNGYYQHRNRHEPACLECKAALRIETAQKRALSAAKKVPA